MILEMRSALKQMAALVVLAALLALGANHWRSDGIALVGDWSVEARLADAGGHGLVIDIEQARQLFERREVLFVDARPESEYRQGHIRGALNLPWPRAEERFVEVAERLEAYRVIVTYCDGEACTLGHELADFLRAMGFETVRVLINGWSRWWQAGLPIDKGN